MNPRATVLALLLTATAAHGDLVGTVMDLDGHPLSRVHITASKPETRQQRMARLVLRGEPDVVGTTETDAAGRFVIKADAAMNVADLSITSSDYVPVALRLRAPSDDAGTIVLLHTELRKLHVLDHNQPVVNATVIAVSDFEAALTATTDDHGDCVLPDPDTWASRLIVVHRDYAPFVAFRKSGERFPASIDLQAGVSVSGNVTSPDGPVANASIWVDGLPLAKSDQRGQWTVAHASRSMTQIAACSDRECESVSAHTSPVAITFGATGGIAGTVKDWMTARPVAGLELRKATDDPRSMDLSVFTDADGQFHWPVSKATAITLTGVKPGYRLTVTTDAATHLEVRAEPTLIIRGAVNDEHGRPVAASLVMVSNSRSMTGPPVATYSAPDGHFVLREIPLSALRLEAVKRGYFGGNKEIAALHGTDANFTITRGMDLRGSIVDTQSLPVAGAEIAIRQAGRKTLLSTTRSNRDGSFSVHLRGGLYDLGIAQEGYSTTWRKDVRLDETTPSMQITIDRGLIQEGRVVRHDGDPATGYYVGASIEGPPIKPVSTDDNGRFRLAALPPGSALLRIGKAGNGFLLTRQISVPATDLTITLPETEPIHGHVIDAATGEAIGKFTIDLASRKDNVRLLAPMAFETTDGRFEIPDAPKSPLVISVRADKYAQVQRIVEPHTEDVVIELHRSVTISGHVTDEDGQPVTGVRVTPRDSAGSDTATTGPSGDYGLEVAANGSAEFRFDKAGFESSFLKVSGASSTDRADVTMKHGRQISGTVVDDHGAPVAGATVATTGTAAALSDDNGTFLLTAGTCPCSVRASKAGYVATTVDGLSAPTTSIELRLKHGITLEGTVSGLSPAELSATHIAVLTTGGVVSAACDASGHYRLDGLPQGHAQAEAELQFGAESRSSEEVTLDIASTDLHHDFTFSSEPLVTGQVSRAREPLANARLTFRPQSNPNLPHASTRTSADGSYRVAGLGSGSYEVVIDSGAVHQSQVINVSGSTKADLSVSQ